MQKTVCQACLGTNLYNGEGFLNNRKSGSGLSSLSWDIQAQSLLTMPSLQQKINSERLEAKVSLAFCSTRLFKLAKWGTHKIRIYTFWQLPISERWTRLEERLCEHRGSFKEIFHGRRSCLAPTRIGRTACLTMHLAARGQQPPRKSAQRRPNASTMQVSRLFSKYGDGHWYWRAWKYTSHTLGYQCSILHAAPAAFGSIVSEESSHCHPAVHKHPKALLRGAVILFLQMICLRAEVLSASLTPMNCIIHW